MNFGNLFKSGASGAAAGASTGNAWGAVAGAGLGILGGLIGNAQSANMQYEYQSKLQQQQQQWLEQMSNTAHQREMNDLREAGLNPLLTVMGGQGASTPSSGMGQMGLTDNGSKIQAGITSALQFRQQRNQDLQTQAQVNNLKAMTDTEATKQKLNLANTGLATSKKILNDKEATVFEKRFAKEIQRQSSEIMLNEATASARQMDAQSNRINATSAKDLREEEARKVRGETALLGKDKGEGYTTSESINIGKFGYSRTRNKNYNRY